MQRSQIRHGCRKDHPEIRDIISQVNQSTKRNLKRLKQGGERSQEETKRQKKKNGRQSVRRIVLIVLSVSNNDVVIHVYIP
mmetsp:Transcript_24497/g.44314  ORF Transcript_24497/g.44314 Transcript_24497/m.44314 type:complete len:81 (-) Transcript_24497:205-447(-)